MCNANLRCLHSAVQAVCVFLKRKSVYCAHNLNTVKPWLSNDSVLDLVGFRPKNSRFLRLRLRT